MRKICFVTGTRADYGILAPVMREVTRSDEAIIQIIATNMHLSPQFGYTINEIEADGFSVDVKIDSLIPGGSSNATVKSMAKVMEGMGEALEYLKPDIVVILGDRYEALAAAAAAATFNIPVAHLHGGEITEGAVDDKYRHAITKLSSLHFASTPQYMRNIIDMGVNPKRVFHSGAPGAELVGNNDNQTYKDFLEITGLMKDEEFIILAMHPVTTLEDKGEKEVKETLKALDGILAQGVKVLLTMPNSDPGTKVISDLLGNWAKSHDGKVKVVTSLGSRLFRCALDYASAMIGNSSAALIEAPTFRLPAVNVGMRQRGRVHGITVLDVPAEASRITAALTAAMSLEMKVVTMGVPMQVLNPYYKENASGFIAETLINYPI